MRSFTLHRQQPLRVPVIHNFISSCLSSMDDCMTHITEQSDTHVIQVVYGIRSVRYLLLEPTSFNPRYTLINQNSGSIIHSSTSLFKTLIHIFKDLKINYGGFEEC